MRIAVIGGLERHESEIERRAHGLGHEVEFHRGWVGGRHGDELEAIVARCDVALVVTQVNSHGAVQLAKRAAGRLGRPVVIVRSCNPSGFSRVAATLGHAPAGERWLARAV